LLTPALFPFSMRAYADFASCPNSRILRSSTFTAAVATFSSR
jgi:hypothetical protein